MGGIGDMVNSAKDALTGGGGGDSMDDMVDQAADAIKDKTPDQVDGMVDKGADVIKDKI